MSKASATWGLDMLDQIATQTDGVGFTMDVLEDGSFDFEGQIDADKDSKFAAFLEHFSARASLFSKLTEDTSSDTISCSFMLDEPTRGIDVGAKQEIYALMEELAREGVAILFVSSEMEEVLGMSDRTLVMHEGRITGELTREELSEEAVMNLATGGESKPGDAAA